MKPTTPHGQLPVYRNRVPSVNPTQHAQPSNLRNPAPSFGFTHRKAVATLMKPGGWLWPAMPLPGDIGGDTLETAFADPLGKLLN